MGPKRTVFWRQGLFLQPQHFQSLQSHTDSSANDYSESRSGVHSGLIDLKVDQEALQNGMLRIEKLVHILGDGTLISFPGNVELTAVSLAQIQADESGKIDVFIALPMLEVDSSNLSSDDGLTKKRFRVNEIDQAVDLYEGKDWADIETLSLDAQLIIGEQATSAKNLLSEKVLEIELDAGLYRLSPHFVPNAVFLKSAHALRADLRSLQQSLIARYDQLDSVSLFLADSGSDVSSGALRNLFAQQIIAEHTARLTHFLDRPETYVHEVYLALRQLVGALSGFTEKVSILGETDDNASSIIAFNPSTLSEGFSRLFALTDDLLNALTVDPSKLSNLSNIGEGKFSGALPFEFTDPRNKVYLRLRSAENLDGMAEQISRFARLGAELQVDVYVKRALPGVDVKYMEGKPAGVARVPGSIYFIVNRDSYEWSKLVESGRPSFVWVDCPEDLEVDLVSVKG